MTLKTLTTLPATPPKTPFLSIITPTIQRDTLLRCCGSVSSQSFGNWTHIVIVDSELLNLSLMDDIRHPQRIILYCGRRYNNFGNTPRWLGWEQATGEWLLGLDDDNYLASSTTLAEIAASLNSITAPTTPTAPWAIFPILRGGQRFFSDPPGIYLTDTANVIARREIARWPNIAEYEADGMWVEMLKRDHPYHAFPDADPIVIMEKSNHGQ
jgi:hypothetical protein